MKLALAVVACLLTAACMSVLEPSIAPDMTAQENPIAVTEQDNGCFTLERAPGAEGGLAIRPQLVCPVGTSAKK